MPAFWHCSKAYNAWVFNPGSPLHGAFFWSFKTEVTAGQPIWNAEWSYLTGLADGYIPGNIQAAVDAGERVC